MHTCVSMQQTHCTCVYPDLLQLLGAHTQAFGARVVMLPVSELERTVAQHMCRVEEDVAQNALGGGNAIAYTSADGSTLLPAEEWTAHLRTSAIATTNAGAKFIKQMMEVTSKTFDRLYTSKVKAGGSSGAAGRGGMTPAAARDAGRASMQLPLGVFDAMLELRHLMDSVRHTEESTNTVVGGVLSTQGGVVPRLLHPYQRLAA